MVFQGLCSRHLGNIKANVNDFAFLVKTHLMLSLMGVKFFFLSKFLKKYPSPEVVSLCGYDVSCTF